MDNNDFKDMQNYKMGTTVEKKETYKKERVVKNEKEPKTAIWWMIMLFCIVYGIELVYNAMLKG